MVLDHVCFQRSTQDQEKITGVVPTEALTHPCVWVLAYLYTACGEGVGRRSAGGVWRDREGIAVGD